jgi:ubiquinone/menaquinone biosynthesis C-methylase UbiE
LEDKSARRRDDVSRIADRNLPPGAAGLVLHKAAIYDLTVWLMTLGRERAFRDNLIRLADLTPGEAVLDVGCGTGSLAIAAKRAVGPTGTVNGIDASPEMLARAEKKAGRAGAAIVFRQAAAQALPFPGNQFDAAFSTVMLHHLPRSGREQCLREIKRVLKPRGRLLVVDFGSAEKPGHIFPGFHRHGYVRFDDVLELLESVGFRIDKTGAVGFRNLNFALATLTAP